MSEFKTCILCRKIYTGYNQSLCPECIEKMDEAFVIIRDYLEDHREANAKDIIKATGLSSKIVCRLLKDERILPYTKEGLRCEICNEPIKEGRMCNLCERKMADYIERNGKIRAEGKAHSSKNLNRSRNFDNDKNLNKRRIKLFDER